MARNTNTLTHKINCSIWATKVCGNNTAILPNITGSQESKLKKHYQWQTQACNKDYLTRQDKSLTANLQTLLVLNNK